MPLTPKQIRDFFEIGYFIYPNLFTEAEVRRVSDCFGRLQKLAATVSGTSLLKGSQFVVDGKRIDRVVWAGGAEPYLLEIGADKRLTEPASQLLGSGTFDQLINQAHFKLSGDGVEYEWHQDSEKRRFGSDEWTDVNGKGSFVQTILAIDECGPDNGPLMAWPGTSKWGHVSLDKPTPKTPKVDESKLVPMLMKPGSVLFLHPYCIHGSHANQSKRSRRVLINGYAYPGANRRIYPGDGAGRTLCLKK